MALQCTFCGTALKDDARYCNHCGTLAASHPFSPKSATASTFPAGQTKNTGEPVREQVAQPPTYHSSRRSTQNEPPSWMSQLETGLQSKVPSRGLEPNLLKEQSPEKTMEPKKPREETTNRVTETPTLSLPLQPVSQVEPASRELHDTSGNTPQFDFPGQGPMQHANIPVRELRVKVWEQQEPIPPAAQGFSMDDDPEDLPTKPLVAGSPGIQNQRNGVTSAPLSPPAKMQHARFDDDEVEYLDTVPLATQMKAQSTQASWSGEDTIQWQERPAQRHNNAPERAAYPKISPAKPEHVRPVNQPLQERMIASSAAPEQVWRQAPPSQPVMSSFQPAQRRKSRKPLVIMLFLLIVLLLVGGVGTWIVRYQPFSVPGITQPQQQWSNTQLGFSLLYPSGWQSQLDRGKETVRLFDNTHTAQVTIVVGAAPTGDVSQYLQQQAGQLGLTGIKSGSTRSFAGETWQQVQGNVLQRGASYSETLLATTHKSNIFTIMLLAPQTTYTQEEQIAFSKIYSSFQFL